MCQNCAYFSRAPQTADGRYGDETEPLVQILIRRASLQQSKRDEIQLALQNQNQLSVSADRTAGVHQTLHITLHTQNYSKQARNIGYTSWNERTANIKVVKILINVIVERWWSVVQSYPLHRGDEQVVKGSQRGFAERTGTTRQGRGALLHRRHRVTEETRHTLTAPETTPQTHSWNMRVLRRTYCAAKTAACSHFIHKIWKYNGRYCIQLLHHTGNTVWDSFHS